MTTTEQTIDNGVNVGALLGARQACRKHRPPRLHLAGRRVRVNGTHSRTTLDGFFGLGGEQHHKTAFKYDADHPEVFASEDHGPTPVEIVLAGLASCLTAGVASVAQMRGIQLRSVKATLEGGMDIRGILGMDSEVRNGFDGIKVTFDIDADATKDEIAAVVAQSQKRSAVYDILTNPTHVTVAVR